MLFQPELVARRRHVRVFRTQRNRNILSVVLPFDLLVVHICHAVFRHVNEIRKRLIDSVALVLQRHKGCVVAGDIGKRAVVVTTTVRHKLVTQTETGKCQGSAGVFFFQVAGEVGRVAQLGLDLFLAVPEIVVGNECDDHTLFGATCQFEGRAVVVFLVRWTTSTCHRVSDDPWLRRYAAGRVSFLVRSVR